MGPCTGSAPPATVVLMVDGSASTTPRGFGKNLGLASYIIDQLSSLDDSIRYCLTIMPCSHAPCSHASSRVAALICSGICGVRQAVSGVGWALPLVLRIKTFAAKALLPRQPWHLSLHISCCYVSCFLSVRRAPSRSVPILKRPLLHNAVFVPCCCTADA